MSKPNATAAPIPVGILVRPPAQRAKAEQPMRTPTLVPPSRPNPWLWIVTAGSVIYSALVLAIGLSLHRPETQAVSETATPIAVIEVAAAPPPILQPETETELELKPRPVEPPVLLRKPEFVLLDETPPPITLEDIVVPEPVKPKVPPAKPKPAWKEADPNVYASCEQIGTNILFVKNPVDAFKKAKDEKKLVFMVHLSGNLEDKEFT
jgi:hypothetical protein